MLETILSYKRRELEARKAEVPAPLLLESLPEKSPAPFREALQGPAARIIAEVKFASPSRGDFPCRLTPVEVAGRYAENGAAAVSVLTEQRFFKGSPEFLQEIHGSLPDLPLLRKDFLFDSYQVLEAAAWGASAYLLIAACLTDIELSRLMEAGAEHGLEPLLEVHDLWELERAIELGAGTIGVNNRNLKTMSVDIKTSFDLARRMEGEQGYLLVSESGIRERVQIDELTDAGFSAFLIGSYFMEADDPGEKLASIIGRERG